MFFSMRFAAVSRELAGRAALAILCAALIGSAAAPAAAAPRGGAATDVWAATWAASPEPAHAPAVELAGQTVRQVARISLGGLYVRARFSNEFGDQPLTIGAAHLGLSAGPGAAVQPGSDHPLTFGGKTSITIPPGARVLSDPVSVNLRPLSSVVVSLYFPGPVGAVTENFFSMQTAYIAAGNQTAAPDLPGAATVTRRLIFTGLDVSAAAGTRVLVALGDSATGGFGSTLDANHRWPDHLAERMLARRGGAPIAVVNAGIGGNRLLHDFFGPNALSRFDRDVLSQPSVGYLIVLIGINDFGLPGGRNLPAEEVSADDVIAGFHQLVQRANSYGIKVFFGTIPPFGPIPQRPGFYSDAAELKRETVNNWIRTNKEAQGYVDFEAAVRDPKNPKRLSPTFDNGDHLDINDAGFQAMSDAVPMRLFE
ncbi:MAG: SGNH/GDSL hydrolase family protein [Caulobacteraceae bacterium]|nr:SGNH/GDSL hydrolase family protein [Caulobacteraceae bacterium]